MLELTARRPGVFDHITDRGRHDPTRPDQLSRAVDHAVAPSSRFAGHELLLALHGVRDSVPNVMTTVIVD
jgi:hypothetical protein